MSSEEKKGKKYYMQMCDELAQALFYTQEYCGDNLLPPLGGWSWFDALSNYLREEDPREYYRLQFRMEKYAKLQRIISDNTMDVSYEH
jgi:hypothetical protein